MNKLAQNVVSQNRKPASDQNDQIIILAITLGKQATLGSGPEATLLEKLFYLTRSKEC
jgi:hypothetical protein